jgi:hypothetical protein
MNGWWRNNSIKRVGFRCRISEWSILTVWIGLLLKKLVIQTKSDYAIICPNIQQYSEKFFIAIGSLEVIKLMFLGVLY